MKGEHDKRTIDLIEAAVTGGVRARGRVTAGTAASPDKTDRPTIPDEHKFIGVEPFQMQHVPTQGANYVPVSLAAKDWNVSARRVRALLAAGRLAGQLQPNGYWQVRFPYLFTFGTRGPALKRSQKPEKRPKKSELRVV